MIPVEDLPGIGTPGWIFQHSIVELSTGIKGAVLQRLLARDDCEAVLYFDPDIVLFSRLDDLVERLIGGEHRADAASDEAGGDAASGSSTTRSAACRWGIFNLGFIGVRKTPTGLAFADWWADAPRAFLLRPARRSGLFTDQKWINHVPVLLRRRRDPQGAALQRRHLERHHARHDRRASPTASSSTASLSASITSPASTAAPMA